MIRRSIVKTPPSVSEQFHERLFNAVYSKALVYNSCWEDPAVDGVPGFVREAIECVFRGLPLWNNYFWRLYLNGACSAACCPEYLKRDNFLALKHGLVERIRPHTCTGTEFLRRAPNRISKFVLLDLMD